MSINSPLFSASPQASTAKSNTLLAGMSADAAVAKRPGQNFAQLLGSASQAQVKPPQPPLPQRAPLPRVEVEVDVPRSTEPVPVAPDRARSAEGEQRHASTAREDSRPREGTSADRPAPRNTNNGQANASDKTRAGAPVAAKPSDPAKQGSAEAGAELSAVTESKAGKRSAKSATAEVADASAMAAALIVSAAAERDPNSLLDAQAAQAAAADAQADPASLASLMPSVAQAVFGQAAVGATAVGAKGADTVAPTTSGASDGPTALPLPVTVPESDDVGTPKPRTKAEALEPTQALQTAASTSTQQTDSRPLAQAATATAQDAALTLAIDKPQAAAASFGQMLQAASAAAPTAFGSSQQSAASATPVTVYSHLHEPGFAPEMATRLTLLTSEGVQKAQLHLNPAEMGPVSVQIQLDGQQAQVEFHAQHAATREVLERSLPELAAALRDAGMTLSGGGVFQQPRDAQQDAPQDGRAPHQASGQGTAGKDGARGSSDDTGPMIGQQAGRRTQVGVLDMYA